MRLIGNIIAVISITCMILSFTNAFILFNEYSTWGVVKLTFFIVMWVGTYLIAQKILRKN